MNTRAPTACPAWRKLEAHAKGLQRRSIAKLFSGEPKRRLDLVAQAPGLRLDYSRQRLGAMTLRLLSQLAEERGFTQWREALFSGKPVNSSENRAAWHTALRAGSDAPGEVKAALSKVRDLVVSLRSKKQFTRIVNLGTGGSDLGPRLLADALGDGRLEVRFVASADPLELARALQGAAPESTLFFVVSKSFTTQETLANAQAARTWLRGKKHFYAVTENEAAARSFGVLDVLPVWDWVGGRFSVWSAAGLAAACAMGFEKFAQFLDGAHEMDVHFSKTEFEKNVPALMALIGVWNTNFLGAATHAVLPYAHALRLLPAYLQQLEMESNGKRVDRAGRPVDYATAPVLWGTEGTPSQHSFHQLLHQGTQVVPADFIDIASDEVLTANLSAQADALAFGSNDEGWPGNRPSSTLYMEKLDATNLGRLIALYEHKVFTQGVIWNINSFDQPGVELGKRLAARILKGEK